MRAWLNCKDKLYTIQVSRNAQSLGTRNEASFALCLQILKSRTGYTKPPVSLIGQMFWREFFYTVGHATPNFDKMKGNTLSKQACPFIPLCQCSNIHISRQQGLGADLTLLLQRYWMITALEIDCHDATTKRQPFKRDACQACNEGLGNLLLM